MLPVFGALSDGSQEREWMEGRDNRSANLNCGTHAFAVISQVVQLVAGIRHRR
jgi:hypothetical protein